MGLLLDVHILRNFTLLLNAFNPPYMHNGNIDFWNLHRLSWPSSDIVKFAPCDKHVILVTKVRKKIWRARNIFLKKIVLKILLLKIFYNLAFHNVISLCLQNACLMWPKWWRRILPFIWRDLLLVNWRLCFSKKTFYCKVPQKTPKQYREILNDLWTMFTFLPYEESHIVSFLIFMPALSIPEKINSSLSKRTNIITYF